MMKSFQHQEQEVQEYWDKEYRGIFWEQGTGKTRGMIHVAGKLYREGKIDAVFVLAPPGVERNWINDELPKHNEVEKTQAGFFQTKRKNTQDHRRLMRDLLDHKGLTYLAMSYDAFITPAGKTMAKSFLSKKKVLYICDESTVIKTPSAKRSKLVIASGRRAPYRRILTGTPISQGPLDIYMQFRFLENGFWKDRDLSPFSVFKTHFAQYVRMESSAGNKWDQLVGYRNLQELNAIIQPHVTRVLKEDVLDLPPKLYSNRYIEMTAEQERLYHQLREEFLTFLDGDIITAPLAIVRLLRLQQILCGYIPVDMGLNIEEPTRIIPGRNPRIEACLELAESLGHKTIIWARFTKDIDMILEGLKKKGIKAVRYDGRVSEDAAEQAKRDFQDGDAQVFAGNPAKGSMGLTLHAAKTVIYYNNSFKLLDRLQSEDRAHRAGLQHSVQYIDFVVPNTVDVHIARSLVSKVDIASKITGDKMKEWLRI